MKMETLKTTIKGISLESLNAISLGHFTQHYTLDALMVNKNKRQGCFLNQETAEDCFKSSMKDELNLETILELINKDFYGDGEIYGEFDEIIGKVYIPELDEVYDSMDVRIALEFHGKYYINKRTGLPFDVKTVFPCREDI